MPIQTLFPFTAAVPQIKPNSTDALSAMNPTSVFRPKALGLSFRDSYSLFSTYNNQKARNFEEPPWDFDTIIKAIDTDSYIKMAFAKYRELFWKEGWDIISENQQAIDYLWQRIDLMEEIMGQSLTSFMSDAVDQLIKFGNAFIAISRGDIQSLFRGGLEPIGDEYPISGYYIIPTETVRIYRNKHNQTIAYQQALDGIEPSLGSKNNIPTWRADEVIHLTMDKKPGRAFGTPFIINVLDDVIALRQLEEDVQNLVHRDLYPLYIYTVGTPEFPSKPEEIEEAAFELANLRSEGGLVVPQRHSVEVLGAAGNALEASKYLQEFKQRVITGLGMSPHHLGIMNEGGNRAVTDTLDKALYDRVKLYQREIEGVIKNKIFNPLLREGGFDPTIPPSQDGKSDRCIFKFREIDIDSKVKKENHWLTLFAGNVINLEETRIKLGLDPEFEASSLLMAMQHQLNIHLATATAALAPKTAQVGKTSISDRPNTQAPSTTKGIPNVPNLGRGPGNKDRPSNQYGTKMSPNIKRLDDDRLNAIEELLMEGLIKENE